MLQNIENGLKQSRSNSKDNLGCWAGVLNYQKRLDHIQNGEVSLRA